MLMAAELQGGSSGLCFESFSQECLQPLKNALFRNCPSMWSSENMPSLPGWRGRRNTPLHSEGLAWRCGIK